MIKEQPEFMLRMRARQEARTGSHKAGTACG